MLDGCKIGEYSVTDINILGLPQGLHKQRLTQLIPPATLYPPEDKSARVRWPTRQDHAKWGISKTGNTVCVGDLNRSYKQTVRGGGAVRVFSLLCSYPLAYCLASSQVLAALVLIVVGF